MQSSRGLPGTCGTRRFNGARYSLISGQASGDGTQAHGRCILGPQIGQLLLPVVNVLFQFRGAGLFACSRHYSSRFHSLGGSGRIGHPISGSVNPIGRRGRVLCLPQPGERDNADSFCALIVWGSPPRRRSCVPVLPGQMARLVRDPRFGSWAVRAGGDRCREACVRNSGNSGGGRGEQPCHCLVGLVGWKVRQHGLFQSVPGPVTEDGAAQAAPGGSPPVSEGAILAGWDWREVAAGGPAHGSRDS